MNDNALASLNPEQKEAVLTTEGPVLVLAGAGSGKTRVIIHRIAHLIQLGAPPERILAVTFTNKAANEMKERIGSAVRAEKALGVRLSTFHAFGLWMVRQCRRQLGLSANASVMDEADRDSMLRQIRGEMGLADADLSGDEIEQFLMQVKGCGADPAQYAITFGARKAALLRRFLDNYTTRLSIAETLDFDDLILQPVRLLERDDATRIRFATLFDYIMVDEYQDTNYLQFRLLKLLSGEKKNVCVVGDDDQSIYGWRGARVENILEFESHFPGTKVIKLTRNYRSQQNILELANAVISRNKRRHAKELWTDRGTEAPARSLHFGTQQEEAREIADRVSELIRKGVPQDEIAVLYRTKGQSRPFQESFRLAGLPYRVVGSYDFFERKDVRDYLAYLKLACNPNDLVSFRRVLNYPTRGVGLATLEKLEALRKESGSYMAAARELIDNWGEALAVRTRRALADFVTLVESSHEAAGRLHGEELAALAEGLIVKSGMKDDLIVKGDNALKAPYVLVSMLRRGLQNGSVKSLPQFLEKLALDQREADSQGGEGGAQRLVTLMTVHSAKGLEFQAVFVVGLVEGLFPHFRSINEVGGQEEERRLFYVALTRAKRHLFLSTFDQRDERGDVRSTRPSRYLDELPSALLIGQDAQEDRLVSKEALLARFKDLNGT
jgi:DNA helicase-2/ATP-dependent DNA helicase PcrA